MGIKIKGKLVRLMCDCEVENQYNPNCENNYAEIELSAVDKSKIKVGDKVWVEQTIYPMEEQTLESIKKYKNVIAHFPTEEKKAELLKKLKMPIWLEDKEYSISRELFIMIQDAINQLTDVVKGLKDKVHE